MLDINKCFPEVYRNSRDFQVFIKLLDIIIQCTKHDIDNWIDLYDPLKCKEQFLPYLADIIGYTYNTSLSVKENRIIMSKFVQMIKNKGSEIGLRQAATLSLNAQLANDPNSPEYINAVNLLQDLDIYFDKELGEIQISYPNQLKKVIDLMYYVRPAGTTIKFIPTIFPNPGDQVGVKANTSHRTVEFNEELTRLGQMAIGVSQIGATVPDMPDISTDD